MIALKIATLACLVFIWWQDLRYRAVYWVCFPILAVLLFMLKYKYTGLNPILVDAGYATSFLLTQLFVLWIYFSIKNKRIVNLTENYLGWGDILFLISIVFYLSPVNYVFFYVLSLILVLLYVIIKAGLASKEDKHIPLAGLQAALLAIAMSIDWFTNYITLYKDDWLYFLIG